MKTPNEIKGTEKYIVYDFYASWCGPCKQLMPIMEKMESKYPFVQFVKVNVNEYDELADKYNVESLPTIIFVKEGTVTDKIIGFQPNKIDICIGIMMGRTCF